MAIFGPKPWVYPFGKMLIFRLFELVVFIALKRVFSFPQKKCQFFDFINYFFLFSTNVFFHSRISSNTFSCHFLAKIKIWKNCQFFTKTMDLPHQENTNFLALLTCCFYCLGTCFLFLEYCQTHLPSFFYKIKRWKNCQFLVKCMD